MDVFASHLHAALMTRLAEDPVLVPLLSQDGAVRVTITGDLGGGRLQVDMPGIDLARVDALLVHGLDVPLFVGVRAHGPSHLVPMTGQVHFTGLMATYTFTVTLRP
jgi:hypothetical protein